MLSTSSMLPFLWPLPAPRQKFMNSFFRRISTSRPLQEEALVAKAALLPVQSSTVLQPPKLPYFVHRTASQQLPVYHLTKRGGNLLQTRIRKIDGSLNDLKDDLQKALHLKKEQIAVNQLSRQVIVKGKRRTDVVRFLEERQF